MTAHIYKGDCLEVMKGFKGNSFDAIVTDPPYGLKFMGKDWDHGIPGVLFWQEALRVVKPGAHMLAFGGTRTHHRLMVAIEDAGWEIRDTLMWVYGSGFPKSLDIGKQLDKHAGRIGNSVLCIKQEIRRRYEKQGLTLSQLNAACGFEASGYLRETSTWAYILPPIEKWAVIKMVLKCDNELDNLFLEAEREVIGQQTKARALGSKSALPSLGAGTEYQTWNITTSFTDAAKQWDEWGTALKPAWEPIILCRKPLEGTVAENVQKWGVGGINIDECRIGTTRDRTEYGLNNSMRSQVNTYGKQNGSADFDSTKGRFPANLIHDGSEEVMELFPYTKSGGKNITDKANPDGLFGFGGSPNMTSPPSAGSAARFFYCAKASPSERNLGLPDGVKNTHPTVKPLALLQYLCRLITPPNGTILDPFAGSGSTGIAAAKEGFESVLIELNPDYCKLSEQRIKDGK